MTSNSSIYDRWSIHPCMQCVCTFAFLRVYQWDTKERKFSQKSSMWLERGKRKKSSMSRFLSSSLFSCHAKSFCVEKTNALLCVSVSQFCECYAICENKFTNTFPLFLTCLNNWQYVYLYATHWVFFSSHNWVLLCVKMIAKMTARSNIILAICECVVWSNYSITVKFTIISCVNKCW